MKSRRDFFKSALAWGAFGGTFLQTVGRQALAADPNNSKKMIFIFQRGGNDGINTVIPSGDTAYNSTLRPSLYLSPANSLDLQNGFARLHPAMSPLMEVFDAGDLAVIHRVGYASQSRSHFDSQDYWEKGVPRDPLVKDGMFYRQIAECLNLDDPTNGFAGVSLGSAGFVGLKGTTPLPNFTQSSQFGFNGNAAQNAKFLGTPNSAPAAADGTGILGMYGGNILAGTTYGPVTHATGAALGTTLLTLQGASGTYTPENGAVYPNTTLGGRLREAAMLLKRTPVRIIGVDVGGWDTHTAQGAATGSQANRLADLAGGIQALSRDLQSQWSDLVVATMTEFGRTSAENGSGGTDHAEASAMFVAGGAVNGGVFNCDSTTWEPGAMTAVSNRYLSRKTDFRAVFGEIFKKHFGDSEAQLDTVIPGFSDLQSTGGSTYNFLNIL
jgi:uncharacterized protein (DUF1501 family)